MKPILFDKSASTFTTNGKGRLDLLTCYIIEERNGQFELEATISEKAYHSSEIEIDSIIAAKVPDQTDLQRFRVYKLIKLINGIYQISAQHITYQLSYIPSMPFLVTASSSACNQSLQALKSNAAQTCAFNFVTDVTTVASFGFKVPISIRKALGGIEGSILDRFKGEYLWDNNTVYFKQNRGRTAAQKNVTLRYGKDITDLNQEENIANVVTGVVPYWTDSKKEEIVTLTEKVVESQYASAYPFKRTVPLDCSQRFEDKPTEAELRTYAQVYVNQSGLGIPDVSIKVKFINISEPAANELQRVKLCDVIGVEFEKLGISTNAKVVRYTYDVLMERYESIEVGTIKKSLVSTITDTDGAIEIAYDNAIFATNQSFDRAESDLAIVRRNLSEDISGLSSDIGDLTGDISDINGNISNINDDISDINGDISDINTSLDGLSTTLGNITTDVENISAHISELDEDIAAMPRAIDNAVSNATAWLTSANGYVIARKDTQTGEWKELIFADHADETQWVNVLRINENGIGFSHDGGQTYTQAWTLDGKMVVGGTGVPSLTVYKTDGQNPEILFQISRSGIFWNVPNSSMTTNGTLVANNATLSGTFVCGDDGAGQPKTIISNGVIEFYYGGTYEGKIKPVYYPSGNGGLFFDADYLEFRVTQNTYLTMLKGSTTINDDIYLISGGNLSAIGHETLNLGGADASLGGEKVTLEVTNTRNRIVMDSSGITFRDARGRTITLASIIDALS